MLSLSICLALLGADPMHPASTHPAPGPEHARLLGMAGAWDVQLTVWQKPGNPPEKSRGFAVVEPLFGGLFVQERLEGLAGEQPFVELSWLGFDPAGKRYQLARIASAGATMANNDGVFDERQGALVLEGPAAIAGDRERRTLRQPSRDERIVQCQRLPRSGQPWTSCEIRYTRRKD
jgi:hypothetical protein